MTHQIELVIASSNKGKLKEIRKLVAHLPVRLLSLSDFPSIGEIEESGSTFAENSEIKGRAVFNATGITTLADDSGLVIDALDGRPGIMSSRFAGEGASDADRCALVLKQMEAVPDENRTARFVTSVCIVGLDGMARFTEGICEGVITRQPIGENGFGYDPIFYLPEFGKTMAQLSQDEKNSISHRGKAIRAAVGIIETLVS
jgi:XTP/dITP diphosphohydrolase